MYGVNNQRRVPCAVSKWHAMRPANEPCPDCGPPVAARVTEEHFYTMKYVEASSYMISGQPLSDAAVAWYHAWTLGIINGTFDAYSRPPIPGADDSDPDTDALDYAYACGMYP